MSITSRHEARDTYNAANAAFEESAADMATYLATVTAPRAPKAHRSLGEFITSERRRIERKRDEEADRGLHAPTHLAETNLLDRLEGWARRDAAATPPSDNERIAALEKALRGLLAAHSNAQPQGQYERYNDHAMDKAFRKAAEVL